MLSALSGPTDWIMRYIKTYVYLLKVNCIGAVYPYLIVQIPLSVCRPPACLVVIVSALLSIYWCVFDRTSLISNLIGEKSVTERWVVSV